MVERQIKVQNVGFNKRSTETVVCTIIYNFGGVARTFFASMTNVTRTFTIVSSYYMSFYVFQVFFLSFLVPKHFIQLTILGKQEVVLDGQCALFSRRPKIVIFAKACETLRSEWVKTCHQKF